MDRMKFQSEESNNLGWANLHYFTKPPPNFCSKNNSKIVCPKISFPTDKCVFAFSQFFFAFSQFSLIKFSFSADTYFSVTQQILNVKYATYISVRAVCDPKFGPIEDKWFIGARCAEFHWYNIRSSFGFGHCQRAHPITGNQLKKWTLKIVK